MLRNKNILFIAPKFFNYHRQIIIELEKLGANVYFFKETQKNFAYSILKNFSPNGLSFYNTLYEYYIEKKIINLQIDYFFLIRGQHLSNRFVKNILTKNKNCISIYYQWDSFQNNPNAHNIYHNFNRCFSFDKLDCDNNDKFIYLPLFYINEYKELRICNTKPIFDILFIGTIHGNRYAQLEEFRIYCIANNLRLKTHLYLPLKIYLKNCFLSKKLLKNINLLKLSEIEVINLVSQSKAILDLPSPQQQGLSIRSIETLAANKKLITSNKSILNENFYSKDAILNFNDHDHIREFINGESEINIAFFYSLNQWLVRIFDNANVRS